MSGVSFLHVECLGKVELLAICVNTNTYEVDPT